MPSKYLTLENIMIHPCSDSCEMDLCYPGEELFTEHHQFPLLPDMNHVAIGMIVTNPNFNEPDVKPVARTFTAEIYDEGKVLSACDFSVRLSPWVESEFVRVDLSLTPKMVVLHRLYPVFVTRKGASAPELVTHITFFPPEPRPENAFAIASARLLKNGEPMRSVKLACSDTIAAHFTIRQKISYPGPMPEATLDVHAGAYSYANYTAPLLRTKDGLMEATFDLPTYRLLDKQQVYAELQILNDPIAGMVFWTDLEDDNGDFSREELLPMKGYTTADAHLILTERVAKKSAQSPTPQDTLDSMIGLTAVKARLADYTRLMKFNRLRTHAGLPGVMPPLHAMFMGSPGTGKTSVARIMGSLLKDAGILSRGHVVVRERSTLSGTTYGSEAEKTLEALREAQGGILFIDEAYQLYQPQDGRDPGHFIIDTLLTALADESNRDWMLILAGYTEPMKKMLTMNPGIASRIPQSNFYTFEDYTPAELTEIALQYFDTHRYILTDTARGALTEMIAADCANRAGDFGNARYILSAIQTQILPALARRISSIEHPSVQQLLTIEADDIPAPMQVLNSKRQPVGFVSL